MITEHVQRMTRSRRDLYEGGPSGERRRRLIELEQELVKLVGPASNTEPAENQDSGGPHRPRDSGNGTTVVSEAGKT